MCGRFTLRTPAATILEAMQAQGPDYTDAIQPRYNIAPSQLVPSVALKKGNPTQRGLAFLRWGFTPSWSDGRLRPINAKAEGVATNGMFRTSFAKRRCLVPADGFIEWKTEGRKKHPFHFTLASGELFAFAGLWDTHQEFGPSCCIVTTTPNELVAEVHDRMPVILHATSYAKWLDPNATPEELQALLVPFPADEMEATPISDYVNNAKNEGPDCLRVPNVLFA